MSYKFSFPKKTATFLDFLLTLFLSHPIEHVESRIYVYMNVYRSFHKHV